jgi:LL-H family phage holin
MNEITFMILKIVISITAALVTVYLIPYIKSQTKTKQQEEILQMIDIAVKAAEQTLKTGKAKKADVIEYMVKWLNEKGIKITDEQLDKLIEAAVYTMKNDTIVIDGETA